MKKNIGKKIGWSLMSFLPVLVSIVAQLALGVILGIVFMVIDMAQNPIDATNPEAIAEMTDSLTEMILAHSGKMVFGYHIFGTILFGIWYYFGCGRPKITNPIKSFKGKTLPSVLIFSFGLCLFANAFVLIGQYIAPEAIEAYMELMETAGIGVDAFAIIASVLLAPIGEELMCRGVSFHYAKKGFNDMPNRKVAFWIANTLQAAGFGIVHMNLIQGLYAFILGLGMGWLRERYNSLYPAMLCHFVVNFSSSFIMGHILGFLPENFLCSALLMVVSIAVCAGGLYINKEKATTDTVAAA